MDGGFRSSSLLGSMRIRYFQSRSCRMQRPASTIASSRTTISLYGVRGGELDEVGSDRVGLDEETGGGTVFILFFASSALIHPTSAQYQEEHGRLRKQENYQESGLLVFDRRKKLELNIPN
ncbi:hypothetical protein Droror1_Dr00002270 [Drosera rotundifolia]